MHASDTCTIQKGGVRWLGAGVRSFPEPRIGGVRQIGLIA